MKKAILLISLVSFYFISTAQEEWTLIHPYPTLNNLIDAHFISEQKGWAVGLGGLIMVTEDGGTIWETQHSNPDESLWSIFFIDDNNGWAVGWSSIYHTTNAGNTWEMQDRPYVMGDLTDVYFINPDTGWIVGTYKTVLTTTDGGENWIKTMNSIAGSKCFYSVSFTNELNGCAVGGQMSGSNGIIMVTDDGGITWTETTPPDCSDLEKVIFLDSITGWICGSDGELRKTMDGGYTWSEKSNSYGMYKDIHFFDDNNGLLMGYNSVRLTQDGGETWDSIVNINTTSSLRSFTSGGLNHGITVGFSGSICRTLDGGYTWERLNSGISSNIGQIGFLNSFDGYAITGYWGDGDLICTDDGGYNWSTDTLIENGPFYRMNISGQSFYLLNDSSQLMKSINAGVDWELLDVPSDTSYYNDLQFVNENTAYMCSGEGILVKTIDGGNTWIDKTIDGNFVLNSLFFINENLGWMLDFEARIVLRTVNGGDDWTFTTLGDVYDYQPTSIFFVNENVGFVTTDEGVIFKSINGGETWEEFYVFSGGYNSEIYFINESEGWYRRGTGIFHTYDGGLSWTAGQSFSGIQLRSMFFIDNQGWLGGIKGLVATSTFTVNISESVENISSVSVFPNPTHDAVEIKLHDKTDKITDIKVFNLQGQKVKHFTNLSETNSFKFNVSGLTGGAYVVHVMSVNSENLVKFIMQ